MFEREVTVMPKCKYPTHVKPYLKKIEEMALTMTEEQMAKTLGVSVSSWCEYKNKFPELAEAIKKGRTILVAELKSTLIRTGKRCRGKCISDMHIRTQVPFTCF